MPADKPILITGCSSGIGRATAIRLGRAGSHPVYATARNLEDIAELERDGCRLLQLDVTDEGSMADAVATVEKEHGSVHALVNNAGYGEYGAIEEVPMDRVRTQFETNVFGLARMCQLVLPAMREAGRGRIVNMSSMGGRLTFPMGGYYHASKYAVEAISDALRFEVRPFGLFVSLVEPGLIQTAFSTTASQSLTAVGHPTGPYARLRERLDESIGQTYTNNLLAASADAVASAVAKAVRVRRPRSRYVVTPVARGLITLRRTMPDRAWDLALRTQFGNG
ncbi:MAG: oxidoreductase [Mycobacteriales bacterium]